MVGTIICEVGTIICDIDIINCEILSIRGTVPI